MRHVGTSPGGAGGFGCGQEDLGGRSDGGRAGIGLRRDGRDEAAGRGARDGTAARDAEARARAFRDRVDGGRHRLGGGSGREEEHDGAAELAGLFAFSAAPRGAVAAESGQNAASSEDRREAARAGVAEADRLPALVEPSADLSRSTRTDAGSPGTDAPRRLLAAAEPPADALAALFTPGTAPAGAGRAERPAAAEAGAPAAVERRIADIADRVERALAADLAADAGAPIALRIPLDGDAAGLSSLTVTATAQGLDVTLARAEGEAPSAELLQAAQGLAERLQRRLGRGSVRVFEGVETTGVPARPDDGWAGLSAVLARRTG